MDPNKPEQPADQAADGAKEAPPAVAPDALEKPAAEGAEAAAAAAPEPGGKPPKQPNAVKKLFKRINVYLLLFLLVVVIAGAVMVVSYLNNQKAGEAATLATQGLTTEALGKLATGDATVGGSGQTLTVQGSAIFTGQVLIRSDLNVAGSLKVGGAVLLPNLTVSGTSNLADVQISSLQVAQNTAVQGSLTVTKDLNVSGTAAFSGPVTFGQLTVNKLIMSGNGELQVPNHIAFTGPSPARSINNAPLGAGGTASINGSDTTGTININTGNSTAAGCFISITFAKAFTTAPHVLISPIGSGAGLTQYYVTRTTTGFSVCTNNAAPANQVFAYDYFVTG